MLANILGLGIAITKPTSAIPERNPISAQQIIQVSFDPFLKRMVVGIIERKYLVHCIARLLKIALAT